ncbi:hypothetical protein KTR10_02030 [Candidatus Kaiserbacteria bacterium]|nr:hypothetical protein [Candidatus Kaiserbacteria bacterium]
MSLLQHVRERSDGTKRHIATAIAGTITALVAIVWISALPARLQTVAEAPEQEVIPIEQSGTSFSDLVSDVRSQVGAVTKAIPDQDPVEEVPATPSSVRIKTIAPTEEKKTTSSNRVVRIATTSPEVVENEE